MKLKVGDRIVWQHTRRGRAEGMRHEYVITDKWFDPVAAWDDDKQEEAASAGQMVAVRRVNEDGTLSRMKERHTVRGLPVNGFRIA